MNFTAIAQAVAPLLSAGLVIIFMRLWLSAIKDDTTKISSRMDCFEQNQHACQLDNLKTFALKHDMDILDSRVDEHGVRITRLETKSNGNRVHQ